MKHDSCCGVSRRDFCRTLGAVAAAALSAGSGLLAQNDVPGSRASRGRIDVHHHMLPAFYFPSNRWTPDVSLATMDKFGTETAMLSFVIPGQVIYDGSERARGIARQANEYGAKLVSDYPKRFGFFAALPLREPDVSLKEIEYAFGSLKCDGIVAMTSAGDKWLGDPLFAPVFDELNRRKSVVFLHPSTPNCCMNLVPGVGDAVVEYDFDTTRTVTSLLFSGTLARCRDIRWIVNHSGAALPVLAGRIKDRVPGAVSSAGHLRTEGKNDNVPDGAYFELKRLYYECAHATYPMPMAALRAFVPTSQLLFGTDYPIEPYETTVEQIPNLSLPEDVQVALDRGNAERIWPRLKSV